MPVSRKRSPAAHSVAKMKNNPRLQAYSSATRLTVRAVPMKKPARLKILR